MEDSFKIFCYYILFMICSLVITVKVTSHPTETPEPSEPVHIIYVNATWNSQNGVKWIDELKDCSIDHVRLCKEQYKKGKFNVKSLPVIIVYSEGNEVKRFESGLSFKLESTKEEVQEEINKYTTR